MSVVSLFDLDEQEALRSLRCRVVRLGCRTEGEGLRKRLVRSLCEILDGIRPALVQTHHVYSDIVTLPACGQLGIKALRMVHGITQARESAPLDRSNVKLDWDEAEIREELGLEAFCSGTLVVSSALGRRLIAYGFSPDRVRVVYPGVCLAGLDAGAGRFVPGSGGPLIVGFVGRLETVKNPLLLPEISRELEAMGFDAQFVVVGDGREKETLIRKVEDLGQADHFRLMPPTVDIGPVLSTFDAVLLTSFSEGLPLVMLEAMSLGIPVIAADVGGVGEAILDGRNGFLCPTAEPRCFAERLAALARSRSLRARIGSSARETVRQRFIVERYVEEMLDAYSRVLVGGSLINEIAARH